MSVTKPDAFDRIAALQPTVPVNTNPGVDVTPLLTQAPVTAETRASLGDDEIIQDAAQFLEKNPDGDAVKFLLDTWDDVSSDEAVQFAQTAKQLLSKKLGFFQSIALPLATRGLKVIPVNGKVAFIDNHPVEATTSIDKIATDWAKYSNCNVAIMCLQEPDGTVIVDDDGKVDLAGLYTFETGETAPKTRRIVNRPLEAGKLFRSHWIFNQTPETIALPKNIVEGDTNNEFSLRVKNFYAVGEGSRHPDHGGIYHAIEDVEIIPMPAKFLAWLVGRANKNSKTGDFTKKPEGWIKEPIVHHDINNRLTAIGGWYIQTKNIDDADVLADILIGHAEKQAVYEDGKTPFACNLDEIRQIARGLVGRYKTGEQKRQENVITVGRLKPEPLKEPPGDVYEWVTPEPHQTTLLPVKEFRLDFLPAAIRPWVKDVSERMSVPLDFAGICAMEILFGVTCRRAFAFPKQFDKDWSEPLAASGAVVATSGKTKTPTWKVFTNILVEIDSKWRLDHSIKVAEYERALQGWEKAESDYAFAVRKGKPATSSRRPEEPEPCRRLIVNDCTPESMHKIMQDNPAGLFSYRDELSGWVAELDQKGRESERSMMLCAMNGNDPFGLERIGRGTVHAVMSASLFGGFQPAALIDFLSDTRNGHDGMIARFGLLVYPDHQEMPLIDRRVDEAAKNQFSWTVRTLAELREKHTGLHFSPEAQLEWNKWLETFTRRVEAEADPVQQSHLSKYKGLLVRLAGLTQLVDTISSTGTAPTHVKIDPEHLSQAVEFLGYLESHMRRIYACIRTPEEKALDSMVDRILRGDLQDGFTTRDLVRKRWAGLAAAETIDGTLVTLYQMGWVVSALKSGSVGKPTTRWYLNPALKGFRRLRG